jgi:hypothetical protein
VNSQLDVLSNFQDLAILFHKDFHFRLLLAFDAVGDGHVALLFGCTRHGGHVADLGRLFTLDDGEGRLGLQLLVALVGRGLGTDGAHVTHLSLVNDQLVLAFTQVKDFYTGRIRQNLLAILHEKFNRRIFIFDLNIENDFLSFNALFELAHALDEAIVGFNVEGSGTGVGVGSDFDVTSVFQFGPVDEQPAFLTLKFFKNFNLFFNLFLFFKKITSLTMTIRLPSGTISTPSLNHLTSASSSSTSILNSTLSSSTQSFPWS